MLPTHILFLLIIAFIQPAWTSNALHRRSNGTQIFSNTTSIPSSTLVPTNSTTPGTPTHGRATCWFTATTTKIIWATPEWKTLEVSATSPEGHPSTAVETTTQTVPSEPQITRPGPSNLEIATQEPTVATKVIIIEAGTNATSTSFINSITPAPLPIERNEAGIPITTLVLFNKYAQTHSTVIVTYPTDYIFPGFDYEWSTRDGPLETRTFPSFPPYIDPTYPGQTHHSDPLGTYATAVLVERVDYLGDYYRTSHRNELFWCNPIDHDNNHVGAAIRTPLRTAVVVVSTSYVIRAEPTDEGGRRVVSSGASQENYAAQSKAPVLNGDLGNVIESSLRTTPTRTASPISTPLNVSPPQTKITNAPPPELVAVKSITNTFMVFAAKPKTFTAKVIQSSQVNGIVIGTQTLTPGGAAITIGSGSKATILSVNSAGQLLALSNGTPTATIPVQTTTEGPAVKGNIIETITPSSIGLVAVQTKDTPLGPFAAHSTIIGAIALPSKPLEYKVLIVDEATVTIQEPTQTTNPHSPNPSITALPGIPLQVHTTLIRNGSYSISAYIIGTQTLYPGRGIDVPIDSTTLRVSLTTDAAGATVLVVGNQTTTLPAPGSRMPKMIVSAVYVTYTSISTIVGAGDREWGQRYTAKSSDWIKGPEETGKSKKSVAAASGKVGDMMWVVYLVGGVIWWRCLL